MIVRSVCIMILWYILLAPLLINMYQRVVKSKQNTYASEIQRTIQILPPMRYIIYQVWHDTGNLSGYNRIKRFIIVLLVSLFSAEFYSDEKN